MFIVASMKIDSNGVVCQQVYRLIGSWGPVCIYKSAVVGAHDATVMMLYVWGSLLKEGG